LFFHLVMFSAWFIVRALPRNRVRVPSWLRACFNARKIAKTQSKVAHEASDSNAFHGIVFRRKSLCRNRGEPGEALVQRPELQAFISGMVEKYGFERPALEAVFRQVELKPVINQRDHQARREQEAVDQYRPQFLARRASAAASSSASTTPPPWRVRSANTACRKR